jgi:hypothetical protein
VLRYSADRRRSFWLAASEYFIFFAFMILVLLLD